MNPLTIEVALSNNVSVSTQTQGTEGVSGTAVTIVSSEECDGTATC